MSLTLEGDDVTHHFSTPKDQGLIWAFKTFRALGGKSAAPDNF